MEQKDFHLFLHYYYNIQDEGRAVLLTCVAVKQHVHTVYADITFLNANFTCASVASSFNP